MSNSIKRLSVILSVLLLALLVNINYLTVVRGGELRNQAGNTRVILDEYSRERGAILIGGSPVASSERTDDDLVYLRRYANGPVYAPATGFYSLVYGASGVERAENDVLAGTADLLFGRRLVDLFTGRQPRGGSVALTIDPRAQRAAAKALGNRRGAVIALDPATGAILAMVSSPSYDPNRLSSHDPADIRTYWSRLINVDGQPLLNRPIAQTYPPGSVFKVITAAAALESGSYTAASMLKGPARLALPQTTATISNFDRRACLGGRLTLADALRISCNTAFAALGMELGGDALRSMAEGFGFGSSFDLPMSSATSRFPANLNAPQTAQSAIGQFDVAATPLQMAMVAAGIANRGIVMQPFLVSERLSPELTVLSITQPEEFSRPISSNVAASLTSMMIDVVRRGTGGAAAINGIDVAGKTGTAQRGEGQAPHAWFISFAPAAAPRIAVAVIVEAGGDLGSEATGGRLAAPIARAVIAAVLGTR
jgi:peptidoglycan glycosyltransferase